MSKKKKTIAEWLGELSDTKLLEVFREWYIPAIRNKFYDLEERIKKLEEFRMIHDDTLTEGGG